MTGTFPAYGMSPSLSTITSTSSSITSSIPDTEREYSSLPLDPADKARGRIDEDPRVYQGEPLRGLYSFQIPHTAALPQRASEPP